MIILYRKHVNGIGTWKIWNDGPVLTIAHATCEGGSEVVHQEVVETNLSGRSIEEQIQLRIKSRVNRMLDRGYKCTREEALNGVTNQLGLYAPMLAQKLRDVRNFREHDASLQKKLDGHRCLTTRDADEIIPYSRKGKVIPAIKHIIEPLKKRLPDGVTIDGELYCHGVPLQTIGSWIKREQPNTARLWYVCYDLISNDTFLDRFNELTEILKPITGPDSPIKLLTPRPFESHDNMWSFFREARNQDFEGLIIRTNDKPYEHGLVRSNSLIKVKECLDQEFKVTDIYPAPRGGWAMCRCITDEGKTFDTSAPGSIPQKMEVLENKEKYIGQMLTVEFSMWTNDRLPFHAVALRWREDI